MIAIKRVYDPPAPEDGARYLVERLWPRGIRKESLVMEAWLKDVAPSHALRKWYGHDPAKWPEFQSRYRDELDADSDAVGLLLTAARQGSITLLYSARDTERNSAVVLGEYLRQRLEK